MHNKAQASLEMALFGSLTLVAIVSLFSYAQKVNDQQYVAQAAFRKALANAGAVNGSASYNIIEHHRYIAGDLFRKGSRSAVSDAGNVLWGKIDISVVEKPNEDNPNKTHKELEYGEFGSSNIYKINEDEVTFTLPSESNESLTNRLTTLNSSLEDAIAKAENGEEIPDSVKEALEAYEESINFEQAEETLVERLTALLDASKEALEGLQDEEKLKGSVRVALEAYEEALGIKRSLDIGNEAWELSTETAQKTEDSDSISTTHSLNLQDTITLRFDETTEQADGAKTTAQAFEITQYLYRDSDGKYKYSQNASGGVIRSYTWTTPH